MYRRLFLCLLAVVVFPASAPAGGRPEQWVVVVAPAYRAAVRPLCAHRRSQGMHVEVLATTDVLTPRQIRDGDAARLRDKVQALCRGFQGTSYVFLVGAADATGLTEPERKVVPALPGTAGRMKGQPSDNGYGSPGRDLLDRVAVGRFPARSVDEARQMVGKTIAYETDRRPGEWRRRLTVLAGVPAFNPLVDRLVERLALARLDQINPVWTGRAVYHNASSRFCVPDDRLHDRALAYVQDGQALTLYLGHSWWRGFYAGAARYLTRDDWATLKIPRGPGVFVTFGCYGCQLPGREREEGYGVAAMRNPNGPAAVIGSHGICFSAMVQLAANGLFEGLLAHEPPERLGPAWLAVQAGVAHGTIDRLTYRLLDAVDGDSRIPQATQRLEHEEMFLLLGDPALRLPVLPADIALKTGAVVPGKTLSVTGKLPKRLYDSPVRVTLERPAASEPADLRPLPKAGRERDKVMLENHARANQFVLSTRETTADGSDFAVSFDMPAKLPWRRLLLRAYAVRGSDEGLGVVTVKLR